MAGKHDPEVARISATTRRSFMAGTTVAAATAALTACTEQGGGPKRAEVKTGELVGKTDLVPIGGGKIFMKASIVVTQPTAGEYVGLSAICTHQKCTLREVSNGKIYCGCHGSEFDLEGNVLNPPATAALEKKAITIDGDKILLG